MADRRQEIYCHECGKYVQFTIDDELDGEHVLTCPNCGHLHYRYVDAGRISDRRWRSSAYGYNLNAVPVGYGSYTVPTSSVTYSSISTTSSDGFIVWGTA